MHVETFGEKNLNVINKMDRYLKNDISITKRLLRDKNIHELRKRHEIFSLNHNIKILTCLDPFEQIMMKRLINAEDIDFIKNHQSYDN